MSQVVQLKCPGCQNLLRIPANWVGQSLRCKHCGRVIQIKPRSNGSSVPGTQQAAPSRPPQSVGKAPSPAGSVTKEGRAAPPVAPPATPNRPAPAMAIPVADAVPAGPPSIPTAMGFPAAPDDQPFSQLSGAGGTVVPRYRRRKRNSWVTLVVAGMALLLLAGASAVVTFNVGGTRNRLAAVFNSGSGATEDKSDKDGVVRPKGKEELPKPPKDFPRRALAISVNNYLYANPISYGDAEQSVGGVVKKVASVLHIPDDQVAELSDASPQPIAPLKPVIESTITDFLDSCRAQDRIILLFVGHAVAIGDDAYLVPIEGEMAVKETLIPLAWVYDKLAKCPARQKVLILDVCRFDPTRGLERPGSGPMAEKLDAALQKPPAGVQVWSACAAGQYSYEGYLFISNGTTSHGGIFLGELWEAVGPFQKKVKLGIAKPEDSLPISTLAQGVGEAKGVNKGTEYEVGEDYKEKETPRLVGQEAAEGAPFNPEEPMPPRLGIKPPPPPPGGVASTELIVTILKESGAEVTRPGTEPLKVSSMPLFDAKVLKPFAEEGSAKTPLREAVANAIAVLNKFNKEIKEEFRGAADNDTIKKQILKEQEEPARAIYELQEAEDRMDKAAEDLDGVPKRWQAAYQYMKAKVEARLAYVDEYDFMLGQIRKDALPPRDPVKHAGWRLAAQEKLQSGARAREHAAKSKKILLKMASKFKGTPWEILAKRENLTALGLKWQLIPQQ